MLKILEYPWALFCAVAFAIFYAAGFVVFAILSVITCALEDITNWVYKRLF